MNRSLLLVLPLLVLSVLLPGCFREVIRDQDCLRKSNDDKILVVTKDGWRYWFSGGEYSIGLDSTGTKVLTGKGKRYRGESTSGEKFQGSLPFGVVEKVTVSEATPWLYFSLGVVTGFTLLTIWVLSAFHGFRMG